MGQTLLKTTWVDVVSPWGHVETRTLYYCYNRTSDYVSFYDHDGTLLFSYQDDSNGLMDAILRLEKGDIDSEGIEYMTPEDKKLCGL